MVDSPPNQEAYYEQVWQIVRQVPRGSVVTYGQVAQMIAVPEGVDAQTYQAFGSRWVGTAMGASPDDVPWQRVVNSQGKISYGRGERKQRELLEAEGVVFVKDKIDLKVYQWQGPGSEARPRQARLF